MTFLQDELQRTAHDLFAERHGALRLSQLTELGWEELIAEEPELAVGTVAEAQGRHLGTSRIVELEFCRELGLDPGTHAIGLPLSGTTFECSPTEALLLADAADVRAVAVAVAHADGVRLCVLDPATVEAEPVVGVDRDAAWTRVRGVFVPESGSEVPPAIWTRAVARGRLALTHELIGVGQGMLELAVRHVTERTQFGAPLGTFQAVQHRLADVHVDLEAARAVARSAWLDGDPATAAGARLAAGGAVETATRHCHQVMGAIGCTWEHDMHRYIRRGLLLGLLLSADETTWRSVLEAARGPARAEFFG